MSKWPMRGHFRYLRFKTFPMTLRTPQCEVFWAFLSNPKHSGVPEDSKSPTLGVLGFTPTLGQSGVATGRARSNMCESTWGEGGGVCDQGLCQRVQPHSPMGGQTLDMALDNEIEVDAQLKVFAESCMHQRASNTSRKPKIYD